jgi:hypothetical protein
MATSDTEFLYEGDDHDFNKEVIWRGPFRGFYPEGRGSKRKYGKTNKRRRAIKPKIPHTLNGLETKIDAEKMLHELAVEGRIQFEGDHGSQDFHEKLVNYLELSRRLMGIPEAPSPTTTTKRTIPRQ